MNRPIPRLAGASAILLLAAALGASPALAAGPALAATDPAAAAARADDPSAQGRVHCAAEWLAVTTNPSVATLSAAGRCEIDRRLATLGKLRSGVGGAPALTDAHATALRSILDASTSGLRGLRAEIDADTTVAALRKDVRRIFADYRVYALVTRQVALVRADDAVDAAGAALQTAADALSARIERAASGGKDVTEARSHLAAMRTATATALARVDGSAERVLGLTPSGWNGGTAQPVLRDAREALVAARSSLRTALAEARKAAAALA